MSVGTADFEEYAVRAVAELADVAAAHVNGKATRVELASAVGRARAFLADEERFQAYENGVQPGAFEQKEN